MTLMKRIISYVEANWLYSGIAGVVVLLLGWWLFFGGNGDEAEELLTVSAGDFVQEVSVSGKVVAAQDVDLGFSQSGRVSGVYVKVGDFVGAGTLLAQVENGELRGAVLQKQAALDNQRSKLKSLEGGTRPEELDVSRSKVTSAEVEFSQANQALLDELQDAYTTSDDAVRNQVDQFVSNPRNDPQLNFGTTDSQLETAFESKRVSAETALVSWQTMLSSLGFSNSAVAVSAAQKNLSLINALLSDASSILNKAVPNSSVTQTTITSYVADISVARTSINAAAAALTSAVTAQKNAAAALETAKKDLALKLAGTSPADIEAQVAQVKAAEADVVSAQAQLQKTLIVAPFSGIITTVDLKVGAVTSSNDATLSMINNGAFQIESFVPEINIALLKVGDEASITLDAYGEDTPFAASIVSLDPAETIRDGVSTYRAILQFKEQDPRVKAGMTANVVITTEKKINVISIPQNVVVEREGKKYVPVKMGEESAEREVTTGSVSSLGNIEILSGLSQGDRVILKVAP